MINSIKIALTFVLLFFVSQYLQAQYFSTGQDPSNIRWRQINTKDFQIIFPEGFESKAKYMAAIFQDLLEKGGADLKHQPKKFSVVLHTHSATSNGMVAWAPKRMELYSTSPQDNDAQLWIDHVTTHEYRHVIQLDKIEQGFTRFLNYVFGQQATAVVVGVYLPPWFLEGDAVCTETALSQSGRGRYPSFEQELRAQLLEKGAFSYDKAVNASYKDFVTDRYKLGYFLVGKGRSNYGDDLWETTLSRVGRKPLGITPFAEGVRRGMESGRDLVYQSLSERQKEILDRGIQVEKVDWEQVKEKNTHADGKLMLYYDTMAELRWEWQVQDAKLNPSGFEALADREKVYTNLRFPHRTESGNLIVLKEGLADAAFFEMIDEKGNREKIFVPGYDFNTGFDYRNHKLIWAEQKDHVRWEKADRSVVVSYNTQTKTRRRYSNKNSWFAPAYSADGSKFVAVEVDRMGENALVVIDETTGKLLQRIPAKDKEFFLTPKWLNGNSLVFVLLNEKGKSMVSVDLTTGKRAILFESGKHDISQPEVSGQYLFFVADYSGIDNVFAYDPGNEKLFQVTSSRFGARDPYFGTDLLYYSDYTSDGYLPVKTTLDSSQWKEWEGDFEPFPLAGNLSDQLGQKLMPDTANLDRFEVKNYSRLGHLFNFHSWAPVFIDGIDQKSDLGVSVASQNKLSTLLTTVGYKREQGYQNGQFYANFSYQRFFPILESRLTIGDRETEYFARAERITPSQIDTLLVNTSWRQWEWKNSISFPFNLSGGQYSTRITPKFTYNMARLADVTTLPLAIRTQNPNLQLGEYKISDQDFSQEVLEYQVFAYNIAKPALRDVQYQWAQIFDFNYRHTPIGDTDLGATWSAEGYLYFPGFVKHHGIQLYAGYQNRSRYNSRYSNLIRTPRGMDDLYGEEIASYGLDYAFPLFYPDWNLGPLAYFKRIKMNGFVDFGYQKGRFLAEEDALMEYRDEFVSFGAELTTDLHVLRFPAPVGLGLRIGYENQTGSVFANLLLSFSLSSF